MTLRKILFWPHLIVGLTVGIFLASMCATGMILSFEKQIIRFSERKVSQVVPPEGAQPLSPEILVAKASGVETNLPFVGLTLRRDPREAAVASFGPDTYLFVDPYTGRVVGRGSKTRKLVKQIEYWHRWYGNKEIGKPIAGATAAAVFFLALSGIYLWLWNWIKNSFKRIGVINFRMKGRAREWNWHNSAGFWTVPFLLISSMTGMVMTYDWASRLFLKMSGSPAPVASARKPAEPSIGPARGSLDSFFGQAKAQSPNWRMISMRVPPKGSSQLMMGIEDSASPHPYPRSTLTLDFLSAAVVKWEPFDGLPSGRKLRLWVQPVHTGEAGGWLGQILAFLVACAGALLVWTGFKLAWHRFRKPKAAEAPALRPSPSDLEPVG